VTRRPTRAVFVFPFPGGPPTVPETRFRACRRQLDLVTEAEKGREKRGGEEGKPPDQQLAGARLLVFGTSRHQQHLRRILW